MMGSPFGQSWLVGRTRQGEGGGGGGVVPVLVVVVAADLEGRREAGREEVGN